MSIVTTTPVVAIVTSSAGPGTTPPAHVAGVLQLPLAIASKPDARMFTDGGTAIGVRVPAPHRVLVMNTEFPPAVGVPSAEMIILPGLAFVTEAPEMIMT
jgi:hypothetical protein